MAEKKVRTFADLEIAEKSVATVQPGRYTHLNSDYSSTGLTVVRKEDTLQFVSKHPKFDSLIFRVISDQMRPYRLIGITLTDFPNLTWIPGAEKNRR